jgi:hypothetical protein
MLSVAVSPNAADVYGERAAVMAARFAVHCTATAPKNRIIFKTIEEAEAAGFAVAGNCPPQK